VVPPHRHLEEWVVVEALGQGLFYNLLVDFGSIWILAFVGVLGPEAVDID